MNILVVSAHPDDMEIGMGGTVAKLTSQGAICISLVLTDGRRSSNPFGLESHVLAAIRQKEARNAASTLSVSTVIFCELEDLKTSENYHAARDQIRKVVRQHQPQEIYTLHPELDRHHTHQLAGKATLEVLRELHYQKPVWAYEVWGLFPRWDRFEDISNTISRKLIAVQDHSSQVASVPYGEGVTGLNRWRGIFCDPQQSEAKAAFAEVFLKLYPED